MAKFLIVDDESTSRALISAFLSPHGHCDEVHDGHEAIGAFRVAWNNDDPYDLICLDIMMPGCDGHEVLNRMRQIEHDRGILGNDGVKVVVTTALEDTEHCIQAFREGCESYVTKPIREEQLLDQVESLLGKLPNRAPSQQEEPAGDRTADHPAMPRPEQLPLAKYLITDDDRVCRGLLGDMLSPFGRCDFAYDGSEAIDAVRVAIEDGAPYDLICLDIMMPGVDGHQALETIRQFEAERGIRGSDGVKVIMTTALRDAKHCMAAFREGCESYVTKPISQQRLFDTMTQLGLLTPDEVTAAKG